MSFLKLMRMGVRYEPPHLHILACFCWGFAKLTIIQPLYLSFFEFVHNVKKRGKHLLSSLLDILLKKA
jgi:hypothetical protein